MTTLNAICKISLSTVFFLPLNPDTCGTDLLSDQARVNNLRNPSAAQGIARWDVSRVAPSGAGSRTEASAETGKLGTPAYVAVIIELMGCIGYLCVRFWLMNTQSPRGLVGTNHRQHEIATQRLATYDFDPKADCKIRIGALGLNRGRCLYYSMESRQLKQHQNYRTVQQW